MRLGKNQLTTSKPKPKPGALPVRKSKDPVVGLRTWNLRDTDDGWRLVSPTWSTIWEGPVTHADGKPESHDPHKFGGVHGIYAFNALDCVYVGGCKVLGIVEFYGKVVIHEKGMRGETCLIKRLLLSNLNLFDFYGSLDFSNLPKIIKDLESVYDCTVHFDPRRFFDGTDWATEGSD